MYSSYVTRLWTQTYRWYFNLNTTVIGFINWADRVIKDTLYRIVYFCEAERMPLVMLKKDVVKRRSVLVYWYYLVQIIDRSHVEAKSFELQWNFNLENSIIGLLFICYCRICGKSVKKPSDFYIIEITTITLCCASQGTEVQQTTHRFVQLEFTLFAWFKLNAESACLCK